MDIVSIVVAVYNTEKYLKRCVNSIISQTYEYIEIILVDDGSSDMSSKICDEFSMIDGRIKVIHKQNGGLTSARYEGFKVSTGKYITFIDSDDYLDDKYIYRHLENLKTNNAQISICNYFYIDKNNNIKKNEYKIEKIVIEKGDFLNSLVLPQIYPLNSDKLVIPNFLWLRMFERSVINDSCFISEREVYTEDLFFNIEAYKNSTKITVFSECLYYYCYNSNSLTNIYRPNKKEMEINRINYIKRYLREFNVIDNERINFVIIRSIYECIENASHLNNCNAFKKEIKSFIDENKDIISDIKYKNIKKCSKGEKICFLCFKYKQIRLIYLLGKYKNI